MKSSAATFMFAMSASALLASVAAGAGYGAALVASALGFPVAPLAVAALSASVGGAMATSGLSNINPNEPSGATNSRSGLMALAGYTAGYAALSAGLALAMTLAITAAGLGIPSLGYLVLSAAILTVTQGLGLEGLWQRRQTAPAPAL